MRAFRGKGLPQLPPMTAGFPARRAATHTHANSYNIFTSLRRLVHMVSCRICRAFYTAARFFQRRRRFETDSCCRGRRGDQPLICINLSVAGYEPVPVCDDGTTRSAWSSATSASIWRCWTLCCPASTASRCFLPPRTRYPGHLPDREKRRGKQGAGPARRRGGLYRQAL